MAYSPGSFSKNFGWHGDGLRKLHTTIRNGFQDTLEPVTRSKFRSKAQLAGGLDLLPINFFLHNLNGLLSVDELVFQALRHSHSRVFDWLALFTFNLTRAGGADVHTGRRKVISRPAMWANEFVREELWSSGTWRKSALGSVSIDSFLNQRLDATENVRLKCRNNFRHMFELSGYLATNGSMINTHVEHWIAPALFLVWDRHILDGGKRDSNSLLALISSDEIYKLLGTTRESTLAHAANIVDLYRKIGCLARFSDASGTSLGMAFKVDQTEFEEFVEPGLAWVDTEKANGPVERRIIERNQQQRDRRKAAGLKRHYHDECQFCGMRLQVGYRHFYSEAAHIVGIGEPHNGPDVTGNMLVLCPNHHLQFDRGVLRLVKVGDDFHIESKMPRDPLHGQVITLKHELEVKYVKRHFDWFS